MTPRELAEIIFNLINKYGYDNVKNTVNSVFEFYCSIKEGNSK